jgi:hypothetical protein
MDRLRSKSAGSRVIEGVSRQALVTLAEHYPSTYAPDVPDIISLSAPTLWFLQTHKNYGHLETGNDLFPEEQRIADVKGVK